MKNLFLVLTVVVFAFFSCKGQNQTLEVTKTKIDSVKTNTEVEKLITSIDTTIKNFKVEKIRDYKDRFNKSDFCKSKADSLHIDKSFYKADFDHNGYTDLLVIMNYYDFQVIIIYGNAKSNFKIKPLTRRAFQDCVFPKIREEDGTTVIDLYSKNDDWNRKSKNDKLEKKTLLYKYGDLIEYHPKVAYHKITKIEFQTSGCFGTCPIFNLVIDQNRMATYDAKMFNRPDNKSKAVSGKFSTQINEKEFTEIIDLLNYIAFPNLKNEYAVSWTDDQSCTLKITYDNGATKKIDDYGMIGTYGLNRVYEMLYELRFNQKWR